MQREKFLQQEILLELTHHHHHRKPLERLLDPEPEAN